MPIMLDGRNAAALQTSLTKLYHFNQPLCEILNKLQAHVATKYQKNITLTQIDRDQAANDKIYKHDKAKKHRKTAHGVWAAVDIRSRDFTSNEIKEIVEFLNSYNSSNSNPLPNGDTAMCHEVTGHGMHFHIQYAPPLK